MNSDYSIFERAQLFCVLVWLAFAALLIPHHVVSSLMKGFEEGEKS